jgi:hypothetical protein
MVCFKTHNSPFHKICLKNLSKIQLPQLREGLIVKTSDVSNKIPIWSGNLQYFCFGNLT